MGAKLKQFSRIIGHGILRRIRAHEMFLPDLAEEDLKIISEVKGFTMTSPERIYGLVNAVRYVVNNQISGDVVDCGVWKGGSIMAAAKTLLQMKSQERSLYLYDTFAGMTAPTEHDVTHFEPNTAEKSYATYQGENGVCKWAYAPFEEAQRNIFSTGYPKEKIHFVAGPVEKTLLEKVPERISLLRLDTDFYESTKAEMTHLFPRLSVGGVIIVDDYGHWEGARIAVDEYLQQNGIKLLLNRLDYTGRIGVKI